MKLSKPSQLILVSTIGLLVASVFTACQLVTVDYLYVAGAGGSASCQSGQIDGFAVDSESGALRTGPPSACLTGKSPVAMAVSPDFANLYVATSDNNTVEHFTLASTGELTKKDSIKLPGPPVSLAVNQANNYLYVAYGSTTANLAEYSLSSGTIGSEVAREALTVPGFDTDTVVPTGVAVLPNNAAVYVTAYDQSAYNPGGTVTSSASPGWVFGFGVASSGGSLSPSAASPYQTGVKPSALAADPTSRFVYVTDFASNHLIGYDVSSHSTLNFLISGPFKTGSEPSSVIIDPRAKYIYVSNLLDSSVSAYSIDLATGIPTTVVNVTGTQINATDSEPVAIAVDPALGRFVYTANFLGNSVSGFQLNPDTGALQPNQATPYPAQSHPTALVIVPHGNHSLESTSP